ncbi:MAG: hypothetical protein Q8764_00370 [Pigeon pea little leaf phytoplasma]|uniref:Effector n=1 Tax=Candidatus Phytoplasma fabacearum TaxID=2982628 RepID=A0ABU8ZSM5_9MOLU|nr:hypothetical protein ['Bituminaria bituminosa' little leaf phytoplasma]MDV3148877.1 hypothetical protein [Pigeon pea little leaf phytoplasma]MDO7983654.1 hypothetical protein ['Bituminaria bituminosa' little leaf phytoplasma]MDO8023717.1 hypothetical protein ['Bituminaria bituminosa' little leaf phytoplasma]MDO8030553.1 hypothetical protein ['Bituminaria bituminosa' little leaf phytoplasma]MDV3154181.1 hypothetical protein [Pigeon pea little leaf phytoplasma]
MFFKLFNIIFFVMFNIFVALCGTLLYQKALENEMIYKMKIAYNAKEVNEIYNTDDYPQVQNPNPINKINKRANKDTVITNYDKLLHYWLEFTRSSLIFLHNLNSEFLSSLLPTIKKN